METAEDNPAPEVKDSAVDEVADAPPSPQAVTSKEANEAASPSNEQPKANANAPARNAVESAREEVAKMVERNELDAASSSSLQTLFREHEALKEKVSKLKALLGRSAKAQREAKVELDASNKKLEGTLKENQRLQSKIEKLASRPTHMELLADFETTMDRAMLSVGHYQAGGQDTAGTSVSAESPHKDRSVLDPSFAGGGAVVDNLLMQELSESKQRVEKLEKLYTALMHRSSQLEGDLKQAKRSMDELLSKMSHLELEKRMAVMEAEQATRAMQEKAASLAEMQMEIDMVTRSAQKAAVRAAVGEEMIKTVKSDKLHAQHLEEKVKVLQEWAVASNQAKAHAQERVRLLEVQLRRYQNPSKGGLDGSTGAGGALHSSSDDERVLDSQTASLVVGAGDVGVRVFCLEPDLLKTLNSTTERVVLRWTFDLAQEDADILFSILKGSFATASDCKGADALIKDRLVKGGAGGETENAFAIGGACTLVWSNNKSWIRPRTVKYSVEAVVLWDSIL